MNNKKLSALIKLVILVLSISLTTNISYSQSIIDLTNKIKGKSQVKKITSIDLKYSDMYVPISGTEIGLQIEATLKNGKNAWTGIGTKNTVAWENYEIKVEGGNFISSSGMLEITGENQVTVTATLISKPEISSTLTIKPLKINTLNLSHKKGTDPGTFLVTADAVLSDNSVVKSKPGRLPWEKLEISVKGAIFSDGLLSIPENDYRELNDDKIYFDAKVIGQEDINNSIEISLTYDEKLEAYFIGVQGRNGQDGKNGSSGANGKAGSSERAGGDGGNGQRGQDGGIGGTGTNGENLEIHIGLDQNKVTGNDILKIKIKSLTSGRESYLKIDPANGELKINAYGGKGGRGGYGGVGGGGGSGGGGSVSGKAGNGGDGGHGGNGGDGGNGGNVIVYVHPSAKKYMTSIVINTAAGSGGDMGSGGGGGQCPNNCSHGERGKFGDVGRSGIPGEVTTIEREVVFDW